MKNAKETVKIWWTGANPWTRACGLWLIVSTVLILAVLVITGAIWKILLVVAVIVVPTTTILSVIYVSEGLIKANAKRRSQARIAAAYGYKQFEFTNNDN